MPSILVDSSILIDVLAVQSVWAAQSDKALRDAANRGLLVINPIIFAEVSVGFPRFEDAHIAIPGIFAREEIPYEAAFLAGKAYRTYRKNRGEKRSPLPDFFIGAHAAIRGYDLLTRDHARYRTYFPSVRLVAP
ncbi:MAG: type II toxin-antitoxin system VapC family toxin [Rhizomicrobium sp.]